MPERERPSLVVSFVCAGRGMSSALASQRNLRIQAVIGAVVVIAGLILNLRALEWAAVVLSMSGVFTAELINTAVERAVDLACPRYDDGARLAKDASAAAALVAALSSVVVGLLVFVPRLAATLSR
ncbi:MAG: diacylglycerol kinase family protein [Anaerolineae bacterium]|nr:diacylglycerol kinase family protein [Anaerolineae bacterium]